MGNQTVQTVTTTPSLDTANSALGQARRHRALAVLSVAQGQATVMDIVRQATNEPYLKKIRLRQLLMAQEGWGENRADGLITQIARVTNLDFKERSDII